MKKTAPSGQESQAERVKKLILKPPKNVEALRANARVTDRTESSHRNDSSETVAGPSSELPYEIIYDGAASSDDDEEMQAIEEQRGTIKAAPTVAKIKEEVQPKVPKVPGPIRALEGKVRMSIADVLDSTIVEIRKDTLEAELDDIIKNDDDKDEDEFLKDYPPTTFDRDKTTKTDDGKRPGRVNNPPINPYGNSHLPMALIIGRADLKKWAIAFRGVSRLRAPRDSQVQ
ncbi:hypothetical protein BO99DRAFT_437870 [Aspergillus violaceofuscus CBS 115571]|uniref:Uncharacterized protein n=1 Tax=Aspergillus violaceofuscus (strain CBS 115571) TaxID=1450538 RepID=A0A2V5GRM1_ASPV1|nr:hypothetical protein BO99DRAFT_437870 [Aspergillus violaceofuscus CBS 115571]